MVVTKYHFLSYKERSKTAFAYTEGETPLAHDLIPAIETGELSEMRLFLKKITSVKGSIITSSDLAGLNHTWLDYQPNNLAWPLMSKELKELIEDCLTGKEGLKWLYVKVNSSDETRDYFIPRFTKELDVLDINKTSYVPGTNHIIIPVFLKSKIADFSMFNLPQVFWQITSGLYVNATIKQKIEEAGMTGINFDNVKISSDRKDL